MNGLDKLLIQLRLKDSGTVFFRAEKNEFAEALDIDNPLIDYVLNVSRYQFQESKQNLLEFTKTDDHYRNRKLVLENYANVFSIDARLK